MTCYLQIVKSVAKQIPDENMLVQFSANTFVTYYLCELSEASDVILVP